MDVLQIFAMVLGIVGLIGGAAAYFGKSRGDSIIEYQAKELDLRNETIARLEKDNAGWIAKSNSQAEQIETLTGLAQGSPQLVELTKQIKKLVQLAERRHNNN